MDTHLASNAQIPIYTPSSSALEAVCWIISWMPFSLRQLKHLVPLSKWSFSTSNFFSLSLTHSLRARDIFTGWAHVTLGFTLQPSSQDSLELAGWNIIMNAESLSPSASKVEKEPWKLTKGLFLTLQDWYAQRREKKPLVGSMIPKRLPMGQWTCLELEDTWNYL